MSTDIDVEIDETIKQITQEPEKHKVIVLNDEQTPMDWVIRMLIDIFKHSEETAKNLTLTIHEEGSGVAGIYTYEVAESKIVEVINASRDQGFPLNLRLEKE
jgi:ATP-dependent Clp protease adaptor protein ClpS|tara:strand:+ start:411 stop:716 length:306 start_codon:yes stop_codon:yes gene_type:complete